jgi:hypothetical protein
MVLLWVGKGARLAKQLRMPKRFIGGKQFAKSLKTSEVLSEVIGAVQDTTTLLP